jgi:hypothetical protein
LPFSESSATILLPAGTYITPPITSGVTSFPTLPMPPMAPSPFCWLWPAIGSPRIENVQAIFKFWTFRVLIWVSAE